MKIEIMGAGCVKCKKAYEVTEEYIRENDLPHELVKVESIDEMVARGVLMTPCVAIDGEIVLRGKVPRQRDLIKWFTQGEGK